MASKEALERLVKQANARKLSNEIVVNRWDYEKLLELVERDTLMIPIFESSRYVLNVEKGNIQTPQNFVANAVKD